MYKNTILLNIFKDNIVFRNKDNNETIYVDSELNKIWESNQLNGSCILLKSQIMLFASGRETIIVNKENGIIQKSIPISYLNHYFNIIIGRNKKNKEKRSIIAYDYNSDCVIWEKEIIVSISLISDNFFFCTAFNERMIIQSLIYCFNVLDGNVLWQFSISDFSPYKDIWGKDQPAKINQIIGVYNNVLWILVSEFRLIGIDVETGKLIHHIENILDFLGLDKEEKQHVNLSDTIHLNEKQGVLKAFAHRFYFEIDLNRLTGQVKKDFGAIWKDSWRIKHSNYYQEYPNLLFFCGYYKNMDVSNAFGFFDTEKAEIIWYDTTKDDLGYFYNPPQANDKLLAILDDKHNLLVYERKNISYE
ncbi:MAG: hypothetical protein LBR52_06025 [Prevotellaceae bacterium]|nr:hypothetical protein [Prevotellaceae bacterium]